MITELNLALHPSKLYSTLQTDGMCTFQNRISSLHRTQQQPKQTIIDHCYTDKTRGQSNAVKAALNLCWEIGSPSNTKFRTSSGISSPMQNPDHFSHVYTAEVVWRLATNRLTDDSNINHHQSPNLMPSMLIIKKMPLELNKPP